MSKKEKKIRDMIAEQEKILKIIPPTQSTDSIAVLFIIKHLKRKLARLERI